MSFLRFSEIEEAVVVEVADVAAAEPVAEDAAAVFAGSLQ